MHWIPGGDSLASLAIAQYVFWFLNPKDPSFLVWVGAREGPHFVGHAELIDDPAVATRMAPEYDRKYWIAWLGFFRPNPERVRAGKTVIVRVIPGT